MSWKNKRKETTQELNENILTLKKQRTFLAKKIQAILLENDILKSKLWTASSKLNNKELDLMEAKKENKALLEKEKDLMSRIEKILLTNSKYKQ